ncbi:SMODS domain-containing nucleotidyltransferase [Streptomyces sp. DSM 40750]|uniref:SMODS domain-containing nucleotidyltransferase n=1 Tax=Streptomyces sp. DSM 40750 TaxID=2801030 RepID=UPI00214BE192|nr:hypothetical protein [Streptomyces sp. DSM 40750]UUU23311.1 hypothetical protein JIX55_25225 [Streptomyces sp. DSM 40750]
MNTSPAKNFQILLERISLSASERTAALSRAESVRENLDRYSLVRYSFITGSMARSTAIQTFSDIDILAVIKDVPGMSEDSVLAISAISDFLSRTFVEVQNFDSAIHIAFPRGPGVDVVPALHAGNNSSGHELYKIPTEQRAWLDYVPEEQNRQIKQLTRKLGDGFKQAIHLTKWWSRTHGSPLPSYEIEEFASSIAQGWKHIHPPAEALAAILEEAARHAPKKLKDHQCRVVREASLIAQEALERAAQGDVAGSIACWRCLLGEKFPAVIF